MILSLIGGFVSVEGKTAQRNFSLDFSVDVDTY
jgi:hypothetical protein